jgi:hypothetical protein
MERAVENAGYDPGGEMIVFEIQAPPLPEVQLASLRAAFPGWHIVLARFGNDRWFEASRATSAGPGTCVLVTGTARQMRQALNTEGRAAGPAAPPAVPS